MIDIHDKDERLQLVAKYLEADTSVVEEMLLYSYYSKQNPIDDDEMPIARMILLEHANETLLSNEGVAEFDRMVHKTTKPSWVRYLAGIGSVAAVVTLLLVLNLPSVDSQKGSEGLSVTEITYCLQRLIAIEDVMSLNAQPTENGILIPAEIVDGTTKQYILSKALDQESTSILAIN